MSEEPLYCLPKHPPECQKFEVGKVGVGNWVSICTAVNHTEHVLNLRGRTDPKRSPSRVTGHFGGFGVVLGAIL